MTTDLQFASRISTCFPTREIFIRIEQTLINLSPLQLSSRNIEASRTHIFAFSPSSRSNRHLGENAKFMRTKTFFRFSSGRRTWRVAFYKSRRTVSVVPKYTWDYLKNNNPHVHHIFFLTLLLRFQVSRYSYSPLLRHSYPYLITTTFLPSFQDGSLACRRGLPTRARTRM